jgi:hypothetical protein
MRTVFLALLSAMLVSAAEQTQLLSVQKIWDAAPHNAFTDLIRYKDQWLCAFREGKGHVSEDGAIRILSSRDTTDWQSWGHVTFNKVDLRDPKLSITPSSGELMLTTAGVRRGERPLTHLSYSWLDGVNNMWRGPYQIGDTNVWLWRVTWHKGVGYSIGYDTSGEKFVRLYHGLNARQFDVLVPNLLSEGYPNETGLVFLEDDTALCLLRRDGPGAQSTALLGRARPPYTDWTWRDLGVRIGGPQLIQLPDKRLIAGVRLYDGKVRTSIVQVDADKPSLTELIALPSGGDTSYPGLVWHEGTLFVSYYSSHEAKTAIYFARVRL